MFRLKMPAGAKAPKPIAYEKGRRVWDEWIGDAITREKRAYVLAAGALAVAGMAGFGFWDATTRRPLRIVIVERDALGHVVAKDNGGLPAALTPHQVAQRFRNWVYDARAGVVDAQAIRTNITEAYAAVKAGSPAFIALSTFHQSDDPVERASRETLYIYRQTALPSAGNTWQVDWCESRAARDGTPLSIEAWRMMATWAHEPPDTEEKAQANPDGWYVIAFDWRRVVDGRQAIVPKSPSSSQTMTVPESCR